MPERNVLCLMGIHMWDHIIEKIEGVEIEYKRICRNCGTIVVDEVHPLCPMILKIGGIMI